MNILNVLPHSKEAEIAVLGGLINNSNYLNEVQAIVVSDDFYVDTHKIIFEVLNNLEQKEIKIDILSIVEELKEINKLEKVTISYIAQLQNSFLVGTNVIYYAECIKKSSTKRKLISIGRQLVDKGFKEDMDPKEIIDFTQDEIYSVQVNSQKDMTPIDLCIENAISDMEASYLNGGGLLGLTTGFKSLDKASSGLVKGDLIILAARPSMGKTALALNIGFNSAEKGSKVAIFSLEMTKEQLIHRSISSKALIDLNKVRKGILEDDEWVKLTNIASFLSELPISIDDKSGITLNDIKAKCKKLKQSQGLDVVIIDYLQLIQGDKDTTVREQEIAKISRGLKVLAKDLEITIIALSQLSRAPEQRTDHRPILSDLRESGSIEQDADTVIFLYRDEYYNAETEDRNIAEVIYSKNRNGEVGTAKLIWIGKYQKFAEIDMIHR